MHRVVTINLNGQAYRIDQYAYEAIPLQCPGSRRSRQTQHGGLQPSRLGSSTAVWLDFLDLDRGHRYVASAGDRPAVARNTGAVFHLLRRRVATTHGETRVVL